jgi:hypothetical protein
VQVNRNLYEETKLTWMKQRQLFKAVIEAESEAIIAEIAEAGE